MCGKSRKGRGVIPEFYSRSSEWPVQIDRIGELLGRVSAIDQVTRRAVEVRCSNRIRSVHASAAIEGNTLTLAQVNSLAQGTPVFAPPREVQEIENALKAYDALPNLNPWSADDFLRAHALLTAGLIPEAGRFRTVEVEIVNQEGEVLHTGSRADKVSSSSQSCSSGGATPASIPSSCRVRCTSSSSRFTRSAMGTVASVVCGRH